MLHRLLGISTVTQGLGQFGAAFESKILWLLWKKYKKVRAGVGKKFVEMSNLEFLRIANVKQGIFNGLEVSNKEFVDVKH
jgi:hypothetical protein